MLIAPLFLACPGNLPAEESESPLDVTFITDVTIPDDTVIRLGEAFEKTWRLRNSGGSPWPAGAALRSVDGEPLG